MHTASTPIHFATGQFANQTMRLELVEIQKANLGRRSTGGDRRVIDPPPVVLLRLFRVEHAGTSQQSEAEINYDTVQVVGFLCTVDLFPVPAPGSEVLQDCSLFNDIYDFYLQTSITEDSKQTQALDSTTFVQPSVAEYQGCKCLLFTFGDLSVKTEGAFLLRYRVFDILSTPLVQQNNLGFIAQACSGPFRIYSSAQFPGFAPSTELTKQLSRSGVRVKVREAERMERQT